MEDLAFHDGSICGLVDSRRINFRQIHIMTRRMINLQVLLGRYLPLGFLDSLMVFLSKMVFGNLTKYGLRRPENGPIHMKRHHGLFPLIDVGTFAKIKSGEIQVISSEISSVESNNVIFKDGKVHPFDSINILHWLQKLSKVVA